MAGRKRTTYDAPKNRARRAPDRGSGPGIDRPDEGRAGPALNDEDIDGSGGQEPTEPEGPTAEELASITVAHDENLPLLLGEEPEPPAPADEGEAEQVARRRDEDRALVRRDPLVAYIQEIRRHPLLSREEEHDLAVKYAQTGDMEIARRLVIANLRLVVKIAHEYRRAHRNLLDLIQEGNIGLMQAVKKYDPYRGVKLSSYAAWWIRAYILKFILNNWRLVKIGTTQAQRKLFFSLRKEKEKLERLGFEPEHKLLAERLEVTEAEVAEMERRLEMSEMSLDAPLGGDDDGRSRMDVIPGSRDSRPDVRAEAEEFRVLLRTKLEEFGQTLSGREDVLFRERWLTETPLTLQEIGDRFGISRERARQVEKRLLDRLRGYLEEELGSAVDIGAIKEGD
ncbi:MAG: RNA polymerase factor sigma-32 [Deltaproteobacteria bacterium]|nr:RNA polymerase factor sigma-32 [Deltaproteobacteria bacterium]